jgi:isoaspartyl peptidase/L-asparaginase-like protein (Ntn-hydrolase superfamily)
MVGSHLVVELMRQGRTPQEACEAAVDRIVKKQKNYKDLQVGFLALNKAGQAGAYAIHPGFNYAVHNGRHNTLIDARSFVK